MAGRPSKCTKELCEAICQHIRKGNTLKYSVQKEGITYETYRRWMETGRNSKTQKGKYYAFYVSVKKAQEEGKNFLVQGIQEHGKKNWQAMAWLLERMYYNEFGRRNAVEIDAKVDNKVEGKLEVIYDNPITTNPELRKQAARLLMEAENKDQPSEPSTSG